MSACEPYVGRNCEKGRQGADFERPAVMDYYYFGASLPAVSMETRPELSFDDFRKLCDEHLSASDLKVLDELFEPVTEHSRHDFVRSWRNSEIQLRNAVARIRARIPKTSLPLVFSVINPIIATAGTKPIRYPPVGPIR